MLSPEAQAALRGGHTAVNRVEVWRSGRPVYRLVATGGSVPVEADAPVRRSLSGTVVDPTGRLTRSDAETLFPDPRSLSGGNAGDLLNAYECEIAPYRGVRVNGVDEYEPLGVFRLTGRTITDSARGVTISLTGQDRATGYQVPMSTPLPIHAGTPVEVAIQRLLSAVQPALSMRTWATRHTVGPLIFQPEINVWSEAQKLAESVGARLFHDRTGQLVLAPIGTTSDRPVTAYVEGQGRLLDAQVADDSDTIKNVVVAESEDGTISVQVSDDDPTSPTYVRGPYGRRVHRLKSPYFGSISQALQAATARLAYELGRSETITLTTLVDPSRDVDEVVTVHRPRSGLFYRGLVIASLTIPLSVDQPMEVGCRQSRFAQDGKPLPDLRELAA